METIIAAAIPALIGLISTIVVKHRASRGKLKGFENLETSIDLHQSRWSGEYVDVKDEGDKPIRTGHLAFEQFGSRIVGYAVSIDERRRWIFEGVVSQRRLCYVYLDEDTSAVSVGTAIYELDDDGRHFTGQWYGWTPEGERRMPQDIKLTRVE